MILIRMRCQKQLDLVGLNWPSRERSDLVVECLTRDQGAAGSSLTSVTVFCL